MLSMV